MFNTERYNKGNEDSANVQQAFVCNIAYYQAKLIQHPFFVLRRKKDKNIYLVCKEQESFEKKTIICTTQLEQIVVMQSRRLIKVNLIVHKECCLDIKHSNPFNIAQLLFKLNILVKSLVFFGRLLIVLL